MKVRQGFVSNSSTTSFCIYGVGLDEWPEAPKNFEYPDYPKEYWGEQANGLDLEMYSEPYGGGGWIGMPLYNMKLEETRQQFQDRIDVLLESIGLDANGAGIHEEVLLLD